MISSDFGWFQVISDDFGDFRWFQMISDDFGWFRMISGDFKWFHWFQMISRDFGWFRVISSDFARLKSVCSPLAKIEKMLDWPVNLPVRNFRPDRAGRLPLPVTTMPWITCNSWERKSCDMDTSRDQDSTSAGKKVRLSWQGSVTKHIL